jgi:hypothetical protein
LSVERSGFKVQGSGFRAPSLSPRMHLFAFFSSASSPSRPPPHNATPHHSKRRGLSQYRGNARDAAEAAARSAAAEQYSPLLESLLKKRDRLEALGDDKKVRSPNKAPGLAMAFTWSSPLEGMGRKYTLADPAQECGMAWMLRAACKRQEAVLAVASCRRAPTSSSGDDGDDDRAFVVVGGSVLGKTPGAGDRQSGGGGGSAPTGGARRRGASGPGGAAGVGAPKSPGPVLGESAPAVATLLRQGRICGAHVDLHG